VGPFWYPEIMPDPNIAVESNPDPGFFYMAYNLRREPWGYANGDPAQGDRGYWLRQAVSHLADKRTIVQNLLQNFGVVGHGVVSPANAFWYNDNIPKPGYDVAAARAILDDLATDDPSDPGDPYDPGFSLDPGSTSDCTMDNPAGCRSLPRLGTQAFEISMPGADYDPVRASAGAMLAAAMRQVGLNARTGPPPYYSFCVRDFDLYILGWRIQGTDPDYLFSFFHSSNWPCGQNYPGIEDATLDLVIEASRREMDRDVRRQDIFEAQRILADLRPYEVLYHQTNIEAYRQDRFVNWTVSSGTIWNEQSLFGIRPPGVKIMHLAVTAPFAIPAGAGESLRFIVRDERLAPVEAAEVSVQIASADGGDPGALTSGAQSGTSLILQTDEGGNALARYDAPPVVGESRRVILNAIASHPDFDTTPAQDTVITVVGPGLRFLRILLGLPAGDLGYPNSELPVRLDVRDQDGTPQPDTPIAVRLEPAGESSFLSGTAEEGRSFVVTFPAAGVYTISADATGPGPIPQWTFVTVWVIEPTNGTKPPPDLRDEPPSLAVLFVGGTAVIVAAVVIWGWRRARRPR
ncbi:MAG TPA: ABC transporter substrate-binding protein, partial [Thermoplasmata archaeon]|nr:ABC transporter substrate-binding protein [Thermoplasmata archaeon]